MVNPRVFFDIDIDGHRIGRVIMELFMDEVPRTVENFRALSLSIIQYPISLFLAGEKGISKISGVPFHYRGSIFHRVIKGFMIQGGDFTRRDGTGGESIYGGPLQDEGGFKRKHDIEGLLSMANKGPNTSSSQFFLTTRPTPHLDGKHVVFGRVVKGYDVVEKIENTPTDERNDRPLSTVMISNCGELELKIPPKLLEQQRLQQAGAMSKVEFKENRHGNDDDSENVNTTSEKQRHRRRREHNRSRSQSPSDSESGKDSGDRKSRHSKRHKKHDHSSASRRSRRDIKNPARNRSNSPKKESSGKDQDKNHHKSDLYESKVGDITDDSHYYERQRESARIESRQRSHSPEIKYKGRGAMKYREKRNIW
ncbi:hypothetical protein BGX27_008246 [Mortierella sp. AM989]|nr:hypothetical protein BGX27_008246 [Mortierella sp. AM989]